MNNKDETTAYFLSMEAFLFELLVAFWAQIWVRSLKSGVRFNQTMVWTAPSVKSLYTQSSDCLNLLSSTFEMPGKGLLWLKNKQMCFIFCRLTCQKDMPSKNGMFFIILVEEPNGWTFANLHTEFGKMCLMWKDQVLGAESVFLVVVSFGYSLPGVTTAGSEHPIHIFWAFYKFYSKYPSWCNPLIFI